MKIIFNDATELTVQQVRPYGDHLQVLVVGTTPAQLRVLFSDPDRTRSMKVEERGQVVATYEGYTTFYRTEEYTGQIYGVDVYRVGETPEERIAEVEEAVSQTNTDLQMAIAELTMVIATLAAPVTGTEGGERDV